MVLISQLPASSPQWFPRPRGDGPQVCDVCGFLQWVPPPTRGWSRRRLPPFPYDCGSPAHAGMVPGAHCRLRGRKRFPRPRGDGPRPDQATFACISVPPPTRGWSLLKLHIHRRARGSPAHAGMVPPENWRFYSFYGFPRPRGDGPAAWADQWHSGVVPPPTRGWSLTEVTNAKGIKGSPAHAGMVPVPPRSLAFTARFPRPRGDGPVSAPLGGLDKLVPPPTRGWSLLGIHRADWNRGSPAHAGMVPEFAAVIVFGFGFPRPRGDGPLFPTVTPLRNAVPPPTRGWSLQLI